MHSPQHNIEEVGKKVKFIKANWIKEGIIDKSKIQFNIRIAKENDAEQLSNLYFHSFPEYSYPKIFDPNHHRQQQRDDSVLRFVLGADDRVLAASLLNIDAECLNADIEQCATRPHHREKGIMSTLISHITEAGSHLGLHKLSAHVRLRNIGIQKAFLKAGFNPVILRKGHVIGFHTQDFGGPKRETMILMEKYLNDAENHIDRQGELEREMKEALIKNLRMQIDDIVNNY